MYPEVMMITTPYVSAYKEAYSKNGFEIVTINNGKDGKGIYNFLGSAFYLDGGCALRVNGKEVGVVAEMIVPPPSYDGDIPVPDENGKTFLQKDTTFMLATIAGKEGRYARVMYTDWRMLRKRYGEDWSALVQSAGDEIKACDCAINLTDHSAAGIYVSKAAYEAGQ
jgi:hypothetical protein